MCMWRIFRALFIDSLFKMASQYIQCFLGQDRYLEGNRIRALIVGGFKEYVEWHCGGHVYREKRVESHDVTGSSEGCCMAKEHGM